MADDDQLFDLTKKKKKKKKPFDPTAAFADNAAGTPTTAETPAAEEKKEDPPPEPAEEAAEPADDLLDLESFGGKKKKRPKKAYNLEDTDGLSGDTKESETKENVLKDDDFDMDFSSKKKKKKGKKNLDKLMGEIEEGADEDLSENVLKDDDFDMDFSSKKKKKRGKKNLDKLIGETEEGADEDLSIEDPGTGGGDWLRSDRDYNYEELLNRVFDIMREKNPDMVAGEKRRFVMRPPQVLRVGTKKTSFANFTEICKMLHRQPKHVLQFLLAELGTSGSVDGNSHLIIKGRFQQKQIETVLRRYIKEYVTCHTCRSPETILQKDTRLFFLQCESCGSRCSVTSIKSGYQAVTSKRAAQRAKNA